MKPVPNLMLALAGGLMIAGVLAMYQQQKIAENRQGWNTNVWPEITLSNATTSLPYASNYFITNLYSPPRIIVGYGDWGKYPHPRWIVLLDTHTGAEYLVLTDGNGITATKLEKP